MDKLAAACEEADSEEEEEDLNLSFESKQHDIHNPVFSDEEEEDESLSMILDSLEMF